MTQAHDWDFFIAHAGSDKATAEELHDLLADRARVFLDSRTLRLGDDWDARIQAAQRSSHVTIVLVSSNSGEAYYQRAEIAAAIEMARRQQDRHRVVPLFLEGQPSAAEGPYGLSLKHGLRLSEKLSLAGAAQRLLDLIETLKQEANGAARGAAGIRGGGVLLQPPAGWSSPVIDNPHRFKLAAFDLDGTLLRGEGFDYSWEVVWQGLGFNRRIRQELRREYRLQAEGASRDARVAAYRAWCEKAVERFRSRRLTRDRLRELVAPLSLTRNCRQALQQLRDAGVVTAIISGGIDTFLEDAFPDFRQHFDFVFINELLFDDDGLLSGVRASEYDFQGKAEALDLINARIGATPGEAVFVGDHFNDEHIMLRVDKAIAYPPKDDVVAMVQHEAIEEDDLLLVVPHVLVE